MPRRRFGGVPGRCFKKLVAPLFDLVRMHIELLRQLDQCLLTLDREHCRFRLKCEAWVPARSSSYGLLLAGGSMMRTRRKYNQPTCSYFPSHIWEPVVQRTGSTSVGADQDDTARTLFANQSIFHGIPLIIFPNNSNNLCPSTMSVVSRITSAPASRTWAPRGLMVPVVSIP